MKRIHSILSHPDQKAKFSLIGGDEVSLRSATGSCFVVANSNASAGIQLADLVLWLHKRKVENGLNQEVVDAFLSRTVRQADLFDISREGTEAQLKQSFAEMASKKMTEADFVKGAELLEKFEDQRQRRVAEFEINKSKES